MQKVDRTEALSLVIGAKEAEDIGEVQEKREEQSARALLELREYREIIGMRSTWSTVLIWLFAGIVLSDLLLIWTLGFGVVSFPGEFTIPVFVADGLLKTLGLAAIVVHFLFNKDSMSNGNGKG